MPTRSVLSRQQRAIVKRFRVSHAEMARRLVYDELMTYSDAGKVLGVDGSTVWRWCREHLAHEGANGQSSRPEHMETAS